MKFVVFALAILLSGLIGGIVGNGIGARNSQETIAKNCDTIKGFSVKKRVYDCARKEKK